MAEPWIDPASYTHLWPGLARCVEGRLSIASSMCTPLVGHIYHIEGLVAAAVQGPGLARCVERGQRIACSIGAPLA
eukprot:15315-Eustigmatos_ZCMA.PRE.1